jgi:hypothetical protein
MRIRPAKTAGPGRNIVVWTPQVNKQVIEITGKFIKQRMARCLLS